jgi:putative iron-only hydrogenase system regulator
MDEKRLALVGIIIENETAVEKVNSLLHEFGSYIVGRMGLPYREREVSVISVVIDAPTPVINSLTGKLGMQNGVSAKALYSSK